MDLEALSEDIRKVNQLLTDLVALIPRGKGLDVSQVVDALAYHMVRGIIIAAYLRDLWRRSPAVRVAAEKDAQAIDQLLAGLLPEDLIHFLYQT